MRKIIIMLSLICFFIASSVLVIAINTNINLSGYVIFIDAGHGGKDNGANYNEVLEDTINLNIAKYMVASLVEKGAIVLTSRDGDYDLASNYEKNRKSKDLKRRVELINKYNPNLFISIHLNTFPNESVYGGQVFAQDKQESQLLAKKIQDKFNELSKCNKKIKIGDYYLLNNTKPIGVIVECGFLTNPDDRKKLINEEYQFKISEKIVLAIYEYLSYEK